MAKKFRSPGRLSVLWLLFAVALLLTSLPPSLRIFANGRPAFGSGARADTIRGWEVGFQLPVYDSVGRVAASMTVAKRLYMEDGLMMYVYSYGYATGIDGVGQTSSGTGYQYFIFGKDSLSGIEYDDQHPELTRPFGVDSLKRSMVPALKQFDLFKRGVGRLVSTVSHAGSGQLEETYCDINWGKHPNPDSCFVTYSDRFNFLPREMSLDQTLDSLYQKRLCKFKLVIHPAPDRTHSKFDRSEWIFKLEEVSDFKRDTIRSYFARYRLDAAAARP